MAVLGTRDGARVEIDLTRTGGLRLIGPGADQAERALLVQMLGAAVHGDRQVVTTGPDLRRLLGEEAARRMAETAVSGVRVAATASDALNDLGGQTVGRTALRDAEPDSAGRAVGAAPVVPLVCAIDPAEDTARAGYELQIGACLGIGGLLLGDWPHGTTLAVDSGGVITDATGKAAGNLTGTQVMLLDEAQCQERLVALGLTAKDPLGLHGAPSANRQLSATQGQPGMIRLFGGSVVEGPARREESRSDHLWALIGQLAEHRSRSKLTREILENRLGWGAWNGSPERFSTALRDARALLCTALERPTNQGKVVITHSAALGYQINGELLACDLHLFQDLIARAVTETDDAKAATLSAAVTLYTGSYLPQLHGEQRWALETDRTIRRKVVAALTELATLEAGAARAALHLERATELEPTAQHLYQQRMRYYAELGQTTRIHHCYEELHEGLRGIKQRPDPQTVELYTRLTDKS
ncbi:bacterial transcriptional activator domain-containing protein [Actinomadura barringtoniae]|uniref:Bacterial transcriptional activator domain-containing protein n=1 Tax=Actinomadura barringtoniae TaxID=1427535 RepID=A0A939PM28_9ACTN|nr:bacterial transcriptional activator domain-containing protein [Actinomadura barringtoniae]MBO2451654.1 bacterial transcriptional activator domain-containing protein [Actinomadura barringtoniae]